MEPLRQLDSVMTTEGNLRAISQVDLQGRAVRSDLSDHCRIDGYFSILERPESRLFINLHFSFSLTQL